MKKTLLALFTAVALTLGMQASFASCPCEQPQSEATTASCPCEKPSCDSCATKPPCCEGWLDCQKLEEYFCKMGLSDCQKADAQKAIEEFKASTDAIRSKGCSCESKCECRSYRKALKHLDCHMKSIITKCQKADYKAVKKEVKKEVKCCHKCLINPFSRCKCSCNN